MNTDTTRNRKLIAYFVAVGALVGGLVACLSVAWFGGKDSIGLLAGLYSPFALGVGGALALFVNGNVKVHQAQAAAAPPDAGFTRLALSISIAVGATLITLALVWPVLWWIYGALVIGFIAGLVMMTYGGRW